MSELKFKEVTTYFIEMVGAVGIEPTTKRLCTPLQLSLPRKEFVVRTVSSSIRMPTVQSLHLSRLTQDLARDYQYLKV